MAVLQWTQLVRAGHGHVPRGRSWCCRAAPVGDPRVEGKPAERPDCSASGQRCRREPSYLIERTERRASGITYDTGGLNIKGTGSMETMYLDKHGGMTVIGVMDAVAKLKLKTNLVIRPVRCSSHSLRYAARLCGTGRKFGRRASTASTRHCDSDER